MHSTLRVAPAAEMNLLRAMPPANGPQPRLSQTILSSVRCWSVICLATAALFAWSSRSSMNPDGMSYLDMASEASRSGPASLVNGYWSPLYPALLSLGIGIFHPSPEHEFAVLHAVNWAIFAGTLVCFVFFLRGCFPTLWIATPGFISRNDGARKSDRVHLIPLAFLIFLTSATQMIPLALATPDLCVCGFVFLVAGIACRLSQKASTGGYAMLGFVLGLSYYAKAAMFPISVLLFVILLIWPLSKPARRLHFLGKAVVVFVVTSAPLILLISRQQGHISVGETGRLNYAWYVGHLEPASQGWTEGSPLHGTPTHPPRLVMLHPSLVEFASPVPGTYPLWFDPSYWYAGARTTLLPKQLLRNLEGSLRHCGPMSSVLLGATGFAAVVFFRRRARLPRFRSRADFIPASSLWMVLWPFAVCCMYGMVHVENRFLGGFVAIFWLGASRLIAAHLKRSSAAVLLALVSVLFLVFSARNVGRNFRGAPAGDAAVMAARLKAFGLRSGDRIAVVGNGLYAFYARVARVRIAAEFPDEQDFWHSDCQQMELIKRQLRNTGVKLLIASSMPDSDVCVGWKRIPGSDGLPHSGALLIDGP